MDNHLAMLALSVLSVLLMVVIGWAIGGRSFERQLRVIMLNDEDRSRRAGPTAQNAQARPVEAV